MFQQPPARSTTTTTNRLWLGLAGTLVCLASGAALGWVLVALRENTVGPTPHGAPSLAFEEQEAMVGELGLDSTPSGVRVRFTLTRLHARPDRQAFDARALRRRFELGPGEPFQIEIESRGPAGTESLGLDLAQLAVVDEQGVALAPMSMNSSAGDPLRTLVAAPTDALVPGTGVRVVLWGRAPNSVARVECGGRSIPLAQTRVSRDPRGDALARIDRARAREESR